MATRSSGDFYANMEHRPDDEEEFRVFVYRTVGCWLVAPRNSTYREPRPPRLPRAIDVFLWGGLSTALYEVLLPFHRRSVLMMIFSYFFLITTTIVVLPNWWDYGSETPWASFFLAAGLLFLSAAVSEMCSQAYFGPLRARLQETLDHTVAGPFRSAGYELSVETEASCWWCLVTSAYVRLAPLSRNGVAAPLPSHPPLSTSETEDWDPSFSLLPRHPRDFRVAAFGPRVYPGLCGSSEHRFLDIRNAAVRDAVDPFTWGAVATQLYPLTVQYVTVRSWMIVLGLWVGQLLTYLPLWLPQQMGWLNDSWWLTGLIIVWYGVLLFGDNLLERFILQTLLRRDVLGQMRDSVFELSPLVEARAGYALEFDVEPEGCCGGTGGYVRFVVVTAPLSATAVAEPQQPTKQPAMKVALV